jgi:hypothetical protein
MTTETKELTPHQEKRKALRALSATAKILQNSECSDMTINQIIVERFYKDKTHTEFKTLPDWNREGKMVIPGQSAFIIWGRPKAVQNREQKPAAPEDDENDFYPLSYLFSNAQVQERNAKK